MICKLKSNLRSLLKKEGSGILGCVRVPVGVGGLQPTRVLCIQPKVHVRNGGIWRRRSRKGRLGQVRPCRSFLVHQRI